MRRWQFLDAIKRNRGVSCSSTQVREFPTGAPTAQYEFCQAPKRLIRARMLVADRTPIPPPLLWLLDSASRAPGPEAELRENAPDEHATPKEEHVDQKPRPAGPLRVGA